MQEATKKTSKRVREIQGVVMALAVVSGGVLAFPIAQQQQPTHLDHGGKVTFGEPAAGSAAFVCSFVEQSRHLFFLTEKQEYRGDDAQVNINNINIRVVHTRVLICVRVPAAIYANTLFVCSNEEEEGGGGDEENKPSQSTVA